MQKKQILLDGKILSYYQGGPHLSSPSKGEKQNIASSLLNKERIEGGVEGVFVFLHGWMQDGKTFEGIFKILEKNNIPYISLDLPGFGNSQLRHDNMTIEEYGDVVIDCIEKLKLKQPILIGHSFGGRISIYLGSFYKNISKIVLIGSAGITTKINPLTLVAVKVGKVIFSLPGLGKIGTILKNKTSSQDAQNAGKMSKIFKNTISNDLQKYMKLITPPTLMIWGKDDDQTPVSQGKIIHNHIKNSDFHILDGTHFVHQEQIKAVSNLILEFTNNKNDF